MIRRSRKRKGGPDDDREDSPNPSVETRSTRSGSKDDKTDNEPSLRRSGRSRKVRHIIMDDYDDDDDGSQEEEDLLQQPTKVEASVEVMVKEEAAPEEVSKPEENLETILNIKEEDTADIMLDADPLAANKDDPMQYILNECTEYVVDEVKLLVRHRSAQAPRIYLMCPVCGTLDTHKSLGTHLFNHHGAGFLRCPGKKCRGNRVKHTELQDHIQSCHFTVKCGSCNDNYDVRKIKFHQNICQGLPS